MRRWALAERRVFQQLIVEAVRCRLPAASSACCSPAPPLRRRDAAGGPGAARRRDRRRRACLLFAFAISVVTGVLAGALPAIRAGRTDLNDALKEGGRSDSGSVGLRTRRLLIVCEVALSLVLLAGAGVMIRSLLALRRRRRVRSPPGADAELSLPKTRYATPAQTTAFRPRAAAHPRASGRAGRGGDRQPAAHGRFAAADRGSTAGPSCCRATSRPSPCARSPRATFRAMRLPLMRGARLRGRRRRGDAREPRRREAVVGRRRSDRAPRHAAAPIANGREDRCRRRRRCPGRRAAETRGRGL